MFPACAGMNRPLKQTSVARTDVPRMRGDEPDAKRELLISLFPQAGDDVARVKISARTPQPIKDALAYQLL